MPSDPKLTKKQRKGIAFRERRGKSKPAPEEPADIPELEVQDDQERADDGPAPAKAVLLDAPAPERKSESRKRKRADTDGGENLPDTAKPSSSQSAGKKAKKNRGEKADRIEESGNPEEAVEVSDAKAKKFILFVGNLPYTVSKEQLQEHFGDCKPAPSIRLLTPKPRSGKPQTAVQAAKSKGCAFLEFTTHAAMQLAIRKHHTELAGRRINVELTAGGGGNSDRRKDKLRTRNRTLEEQRKKSADRSAKNPKLDPTPQIETKAPIRYSTTSGTSEHPTHPKTWSIPTAEDEKAKTPKKRGVSKGRKDARKAAWVPSGANAISVG
ncbi:RNA recognition motif protein [Ceratobasidium sp. AG-Ba]|nr:RNA recognition motif protein [Ceratobasidium sp. AG-Ba]